MAADLGHGAWRCGTLGAHSGGTHFRRRVCFIWLFKRMWRNTGPDPLLFEGRKAEADFVLRQRFHQAWHLDSTHEDHDRPTRHDDQDAISARSGELLEAFQICDMSHV